MDELSPPKKTDNTLEKCAYGVVCWYCKQQVLVGFVWLKSGAQTEDLRNEVEVRNGLGGSVNHDGGCGAANQVTRDDLVFVDDSLSKLDRLADSLSQE